MRDSKQHEEIELIPKYEVLSYVAGYFFNIFSYDNYVQP